MDDKKTFDKSSEFDDIESKLNSILEDSKKASQSLDSVISNGVSHRIDINNKRSDDNTYKTAADSDLKGDDSAKNAANASTTDKPELSLDDVLMQYDAEPISKEEIAQKKETSNPAKENDLLKNNQYADLLENKIDKNPAQNDSKKDFHLNIDYSKLNKSFNTDKIQPKENANKKNKKKQKANTSILVGLIVTVIILTVSITLAFLGISLGLEFLGINKSESYIKLNIPTGSTTDDIADILEEKGIIDNKTMFKIIVKLKSAGAQLQPGDIELQPSSTYAQKIDALTVQRQSFESVEVTFPEGITLLNAAKLLEEKGVISNYQDFIYNFNNSKLGYDYENVINSNNGRFFAMEGYLYPDTYEFYISDSDENVIEKLREHFDSVITDEIKKKVKKSGLSFDEVITLASIVQAESGSIKDMPKVASVFLNRLNDPQNFPRLESDATDSYYEDVIKVEGKETKLYTESEIKAFKDTYDTYVTSGLPLGPICSPGIDAIMAVVEPADTDYLYFCSNLETKKTYFAKTLAKHNNNLKKAGLD